MKEKLADLLKAYIIPEELDDVVENVIQIFTTQSQKNNRPKKPAKKAIVAIPSPITNKTEVREISAVPQGTIAENRKEGLVVRHPHDDGK